VPRKKAVKRQDSNKGPKKNKLDHLIDSMSLHNFRDDLVTDKVVKRSLIIDLDKAGRVHIPKGADRFAFTPTSEYGVIYVPVNRLAQVYQTDKSIDKAKVKSIREKMKADKPLDPVEIGYNYDVHDGHHRWHAAMQEGHTHVPCKVVGKDPDKVKEAKQKYRNTWKSVSLEIDLSKAMLNKGKLIKRRVMVRGKNGKTFYRMQWIDPNDKKAMEATSSVQNNPTTFKHHEEGLKEREKRQSNKFPVRHHPTEGVVNDRHNYKQDKEAYREAEEKYHKGEGLPPIVINDSGVVLEGEHLLDLAKKHKLSHVPVIIAGNPRLKKELEDKLKDEVEVEDEKGNKEVVNKPKQDSGNAEITENLKQFLNYTKKKYTKQYLMAEAARQGIEWNIFNKDGDPLPENSNILWMRAHQAIENHIKAGNAFEVQEDKKDVKKKQSRTGKGPIQTAFLELLNKLGNEKDAVMEWARDNGVTWKENKDPDINWMRAVETIKKELAKGRMLNGVRVRSKAAMEEANLIIPDNVKARVKALGNKHGKGAVMARADELGIQYEKTTKKGDILPDNSNILWMRAHEAISRYISQGNEFTMGGEEPNGVTAKVGDYGSAKLSKLQSFAVDFAKRNSQNREEEAKKWAISAICTDFGVDADQAEGMYQKLMDGARKSQLMIHFDPLEELPNGLSLIERLTGDGEFQNDYLLDRGYDTEHREAIESDMFGSEYTDASHAERPNYGVVDLYNKGLGSMTFEGDVALVLKDDVKKRTTGSATPSNDIPYGKEGTTVRSMEDPHQLIIDRWTNRWNKINKPDAQRKRAIQSVIDGKTYNDDNHYFETQVHGGVKFDRDIDHIRLPQHWKTDKKLSDAHDMVKMFAELNNIPVKYEYGSEE
jgi:hypothetical protein